MRLFKIKTEGQEYKQKTLPLSYKTQMKITAYAGFAEPGFEQSGTAAPLLCLAKSIYYDIQTGGVRTGIINVRLLNAVITMTCNKQEMQLPCILLQGAEAVISVVRTRRSFFLPTTNKSRNSPKLRGA